MAAWAAMKRALKRALRAAGLVVVTSRHAGVRYLEHPAATVFESVLLRVFASLEGLSFIQVGANDGVRADPICGYVKRRHWRGVLLEPVPRYFAHLRETYRDVPGVTLLNAALDRSAGRRTIFHVRPDVAGLPDWVFGMATFDEARLRQVMKELRAPADAVVAEAVATVTWDEVLERFGARRCDVLVIDAEGCDIELLRLARLHALRPRVIQFEHSCVEPSERLAFYGELLELGYEIATWRGDTVAFLPQPADGGPI